MTQPVGTRVPLTVIGGYLGSGKTTLINHLLRDPGGRRLGVIVNDFGSIAIDADLLAGAAVGDDGVIGLANGCACCTVGSGLHEALGALTSRTPPIDHVIVEVSGVADPAVTAGWATVPPFEPGGVIVLAAADTIREQSQDRYVGGEVLRQLAGADLLLVTKTDLLAASAVRELADWLDERSGGAPRLAVVDGEVPPDVVLGVRTTAGSSRRSTDDAAPHGHTDRYAAWSWESDRPVRRTALEEFVASLSAGVLRLKGIVDLDDGMTAVIHVVGRSSAITVRDEPTPAGTSRLVAIGVRDVLDLGVLDAGAQLLTAHTGRQRP